MSNTKISYLYRDGDNYKKHNEAIVSGPYTKDQIDAILASREDGDYFLPTQVGLPEERFDKWDAQSDHPWFELDEYSFEPTEEEPTVELTMEELTENFKRMAGRWSMALGPDGRELGQSILESVPEDARIATILVTAEKTGNAVIAAASVMSNMDKEVGAKLAAGFQNHNVSIRQTTHGSGLIHTVVAVDPAGTEPAASALRAMVNAVNAAVESGVTAIDVTVYHVEAINAAHVDYTVKSVPVFVRWTDSVSGNEQSMAAIALKAAREAIEWKQAQL